MELTDQQRTAVRWQWWIMGSMIALFIILFLSTLLPGLGRIPVIPYISILLPGFLGLALASIGILSVIYKVTVLGRRLTFWKPVVGGMAVLQGAMGLVVGLAILGVAVSEAMPLLESNPMILWVIAGAVFMIVMLVLIYMGLKRAFKE